MLFDIKFNKVLINTNVRAMKTNEELFLQSITDVSILLC